MSKVRQERTAEQIQHLLSELFLREVSDPRVGGVTITTVWVLVFGPQAFAAVSVTV